MFALAIPALGLPALSARQKNTPNLWEPFLRIRYGLALLLTACLLIMTALSYRPALALGLVLDRLFHAT